MFNSEEQIEMRWHPTNRDKYVAKGYVYTCVGDVFLARAEDVLELSSGAKIPVYCDYCGKQYWPTSRNYQKQRERSLKDCCVACKGKKIAMTLQDNYGVSNVMQIPEIKMKHQQTCVERYGATSPLASHEIYDKTQLSFNQHYGTQKGVAELRKIPELNQKIEHTNMIKYGGISPFCSDIVKRRVRETFYQNGTCPTSKKQIGLRDMIVQMFGNCELNYPCDKVSLDCMTIIDNIKIDIEYDGWYWHKDTQEQDKKRDYFVRSQGYKVLRIVAYDDRLPTEQELFEAINFLVDHNLPFYKIQLNKY